MSMYCNVLKVINGDVSKTKEVLSQKTMICGKQIIGQGNIS